MMQKYTLKNRLVIAISILLSFGLSSLSYAQQNGLNFDGVDDYASASNASATIVGGTGISLSCWVYPTNANSAWPNFDGLCGFRNDASADFYLCQLSSTSLEARFRNSSGTDYTITYTGFQINTWQHYVLTYDGTTLKLYKNNVMVQSIAASGSIIGSNETFYIGKLPFSLSNFQFTGTLDEVCLYNKALNASEISSLYTCGIQLAASNLKLYYQFNQGVAGGSNTGLTTANNSASSSYNATLSNFALAGATSNWVAGKPIGNFNYISDNICQGDSLLFNGQYLTAAGIYYDTIPVTNSCDSIVTLTLSVNYGFHDTTNISICDGNSYLFHGNSYTQAGQYDASYSSAQCDSVYTLNLSLYPSPPAFSLTGEDTVGMNSVELYTSTVAADPNLFYTWGVLNGQIQSHPATNSANIQWTTFGQGWVSAFMFNQYGCKSDTVIYYVLTSNIGIDEASHEDLINVFPNPVASSFKVKTNREIVIRIYDIQGKEIIVTSKKDVNIEHLLSGLYFIKIENMDGVVISRTKLLKK